MFLITKNYNFRNRNVSFRADLKDESESAFLSESGIVFHDVGTQRKAHVHRMSQSSQWGQ